MLQRAWLASLVAGLFVVVIGGQTSGQAGQKPQPGPLEFDPTIEGNWVEGADSAAENEEFLEALGGDVDIYDVAPCGGDGIVEIGDIIAMLNAYSAVYACACPGGGGGPWDASGADIYNTNTGNVGVGTTAPATKLHVLGDQIRLDDYATPCNFLGTRANGTSAAPTALIAGDGIAYFGARGYGATGYGSGRAASVNITATENWTDIAQGARLRFHTTPNGTNTSVEKMRLDHEGSLRLYNDSAQETFTVDPADAENAAYMTLRMVDGGGVLRDTVRIEAEEGGGGGQIILRNEVGSTRVQIDGDGAEDEGFIQLLNGAGAASILLDGEDATGNGLVQTQRIEVTGSGDASVDLPASSVSAAETLNEPGIASSKGDDGGGLTSTPETITSRSITVPSAGYIVALANMRILLTTSGSGVTAFMSISTNGSDDPSSNPDSFVIDRSLDSSDYSSQTYSFHTVISVAAGAHTVYLRAEELAPQVQVGDSRLTLIFIPTTYGTVTP